MTPSSPFVAVITCEPGIIEDRGRHLAVGVRVVHDQKTRPRAYPDRICRSALRAAASASFRRTAAAHRQRREVAPPRPPVRWPHPIQSERCTGIVATPTLAPEVLESGGFALEETGERNQLAFLLTCGGQESFRVANELPEGVTVERVSHCDLGPRPCGPGNLPGTVPKTDYKFQHIKPLTRQCPNQTSSVDLQADTLSAAVLGWLRFLH